MNRAPCPGALSTDDVAAHGAGEAAGDVEAEAGAARLARVDPLELVEDPVLILGAMPLPWSATMTAARSPSRSVPDPDLAALGRVADRVGDEVHQHLQRAGEVAGRGQGLAGAGRDRCGRAVGGADGEQAGGAAGEVGEVDRLALGPEIGALDRLQIDEIVDQSEQMAPGRRRCRAA